MTVCSFLKKKKMHDSQLPRSCDRCYAIKERCIRAPDSQSCDRCIRLNHECVRERALKRPGRRPKKAKSIPSAPGRDDGASSPSPVLNDTPSASHELSSSSSSSSMIDGAAADLGLSTVEASLLRTSILSSAFTEQFIIGPSFGGAHRDYMARQLHDAPATLGHAYVASAMSWGGDDSAVTSPPGEPGRSSAARADYFEKMYHHATAAVATLRSMRPPADACEMCRCLVLGATILTFTLKLRVADARAVCRQTLELAKPMYASDALLEDGASAVDLSFASCLVLTDIAESLLFCEPPTLRYRTVPGRPQHVDRYVGVSHSFLPLLYDVAELSFRLGTESANDAGGHSAALARFAPAHSALEQNVRKWTPDGHGGFAAGSFTSTEVAHMLCQAEAIRNAARLVLHRLKHGFGSQDEVAEAISSHILTSLKMTTLGTGSVPRCIDFPLIAACLELESSSDRTEYFSSLSPISSYSSPFHDRTKVMLDAAWEARRNGQRLYWYDLGAFFPESSTCA